MEILKELNHLGLIMDECLNWKGHAGNMYFKTIHILNKLNHFISINVKRLLHSS